MTGKRWCSYHQKYHPEAAFAAHRTRGKQNYCKKGMKEYGIEYRKRWKAKRAAYRVERIDEARKERKG